MNKKTDYKSITKKLKFKNKAYINGKYADVIDGAKFENINAATSETIWISHR
jgi:aldehyde dehydrogenase (NAD+)/gamma-glutamyl-gamma-aminobutyraldehyde dehydrogenase